MKKRIFAGRLLALMMISVLLLSMAACGAMGGDKKDNMGGGSSAMDGEPKNAEEAAAMHKELTMQENAILSENTELWEKVFMAADKGMTLQEDGKNYGDFLLDTIESAILTRYIYFIYIGAQQQGERESIRHGKD